MDDYPMRHAPEMSEDRFALELTASPSAAEARRMYQVLVTEGISPAVFLGFYWVESQFGTKGVAATHNTRNPGNVRSAEYPALASGVVNVPGKGQYAKYPTWVFGVTDWCKRIKGPKYAGSGLLTVRQVLPKYAPSHDSNDPDNYANTVIRMAGEFGAKEEGATVAPWKTYDLRGQLPTRKGGGSGRRTARKLGGILHYSAVDYPASLSTVEILIREANFHIGPYLNEAGIAYHKAVDPKTGDRYILRDEDEELWHCGYWGPGGNGSGIAYHVAGGNKLVMTPVAVQSLVAWFEEDRARHGYGRSMVKGHGEVSETACPGPLMGQVIRPYRAGTLNPTVQKVPIVAEEEDMAIPAVGVTEVQIINGQAIVVTNYGPAERDVVSADVNTVDQGVTVVNKAGNVYSRSQRNNIVGEFGMIEPRK